MYKPKTEFPAMLATLSTFLQLSEPEIELENFKTYRSFYDRAWKALREGSPPEAEALGPVSDEHVCIIVDLISREALYGRPCQREALRDTLAKKQHFEHHSEENLNHTIDLALRIWIILNVRDEDYAPGIHSIQWGDRKPLQTFVAEQFTKPRLLKDLSEKMFDFVLPDVFTMVKLKRYSGIKVDWTYDLSEHLDLDRDYRILKVFPLKYYVNGLRKRFEKT